MFTDFFYTLRAYGLDVSPGEWFTLLEGLRRGLHGSTLNGFYFLARAVLVKTEADFDRFDQAFVRYFKDIATVQDIPEELWNWLSQPLDPADYDRAAVDARFGGLSFEDLMEAFRDRLRTQTEAHNGGSKWIGTGGTSPFGHGGYNPNGIRVGGEGRNGRAVQIAADRHFRDFRDDSVLTLRQFHLAFRRLRRFATPQEGPKDVLQLEESIRETCDNAGRLKLVFDRPRRNQVKLLLLFDSGGSMEEYSTLCTTLFRAANKNSPFRDIQTYYFHNCFYDYLFTHPACRVEDRISTTALLRRIGPEYRVILVGDAFMSPFELTSPGGCIEYDFYNEKPGLDWLRLLAGRYKKAVWLNPMEGRFWQDGLAMPTVQMVREVLPMYPLTLQGLDQALRHLTRAR